MDNPIKYSDLVAPDSSITDLIRQLQELASSYAQTANSIKQQAQQTADALRNVSGATETGRQATRQAASDADKLVRAQRDLAFAESENAKKLAELKQAQREANQINKLLVKINQSAEGSYNRLSAQYSLNKIYINNMTEAERKEAEQKEGLITQTRLLYEQMKKLQEETGKHQLNVGNYPDMTNAVSELTLQMQGLLGINGKMAQSLVAMGQSANGFTGILSGLGAGFKALGSTLMGLLSNPVVLAIAGVGGAVAGFKWWYDYNAGIQEATKLTREFTGLAGADLQVLRSEILAIADTWGHEYKETLQAVDAVASNFKISAKEAADVIKDGFVAGADINGDFLSKLGQYPAYFHEAGLSARQFVAIVTQTRSGIFGDKGLDAIKQANARIRQMTTATAESLDAIGISSKQVQADLESGAKTTFDVLQEVSAKLSELPPASQEVGNVLIDVFGKQGRDAGLEMIKSLQDISTNLDEVKAQTGELGQLEEQQAEAEAELQKALAGLFDMTGGNFEKMKANLGIFVKQGLTWLIKGIISVANYIIEAYNSSALFRNIWQAIVANVKIAFSAIGNAFKGLIDTLHGVGDALLGLVTFDFDKLMGGVRRAIMAVPKMISSQIKSIGGIVNTAIDNANSRIKPIEIPTTIVDGGGSSGTTAPLATAPTNNTKGGSGSTSSKSKSKSTTSARTGKASTPKTPTAADILKQEEARRKAEEQAYQKRLQMQRAYEDAMLEVEDDVWEKRRKQTTYQYSRQIIDLQHLLQTDKTLTVEQKEWLNKRIQMLSLEQTEALMRIEDERIIKEQQHIKEGIELRLQAVKEGSEEELKLREQLIEANRQIALRENSMKGDGEMQSTADINAAFDNQLGGLRDEYIQHGLDIFDKQQALAQSEFDLLKNSEYKKTEFRLKAEKERLAKILALNEANGNKMSDIEVQTIKNQMTKIDQELEKNKKGRDLWDRLGFNMDEEQKETAEQALEYAKNSLTEYMDLYVQAAEKKTALADKDVENAQKVLDAEIEARNQGYASDVAGAQKELELAKKNQEKARRQQEKAQKAQLAMQSIEQAGNLVTATSKILSQFGMPWAIPWIAVMWGAFAASKVKALQMTKQNTEKYGEGTVELLQGGSHQSGNDIDLGTKRDGTRRRAEGGEFFAVINKRNSRRFRHLIPSVISSLNDGSFPARYLNYYKTDDGIVFNLNTSKEELKSLSSDVRIIRKHSERSTYVDGNGNVIEVYKNVRRTRKS